MRYLRVSTGAGLLAAAALAIAAVAGNSQGGAAAPPPGPEGVRLVAARPVAAPASPLPGQTIDGIGCGSTEQLAYHVHAHLTIYDHGRPRAVPGGVGINPPLKVVPTAAGPLVAGGTCFSLLHTHAADGVIHVESPRAITYVLAQFFAVWQQPLDTTHVGPATGRVTAFVDGRLYPGEPRRDPACPTHADPARCRTAGRTTTPDPLPGVAVNGDRPLPGGYEGETVTRRRLFTGGALTVGGLATAAFALPALGFAVGPAFTRTEPHRWQDVGPEADFNDSVYVPKIIDLVANVGDSGKTNIYVRRYNRSIDGGKGSDLPYVAISNRCTHVGCPVHFAVAAGHFLCPCHGGVYGMRGEVTGGPPVRPLDRFYTRVVEGRVQVGPRFSLDSHFNRFPHPRDPSQHLDGLWKYLYPARPTT